MRPPGAPSFAIFLGLAKRVLGQAVSFDASRKRELLCLTTFLVLVFCLQVSTQLNAQVAGQTLSGRITSISGGRIADGRVGLTDLGNGGTGIFAVRRERSFSVADPAAVSVRNNDSAPGASGP